MDLIRTVLLLATVQSHVTFTESCRIPDEYHGTWYPLDNQPKRRLPVNGTDWGKWYKCRDIKIHPKANLSDTDVKATILLEWKGYGRCFQCVDVLKKKKPYRIHFRQYPWSCIRRDTGIENMCSSYHNFPDPRYMTTYYQPCQIPEEIRGYWYWINGGKGIDTDVTTNDWGNGYSCRDVTIHSDDTSGADGVNATILVAEKSSGQKCFVCVDVVYRTPNVIQVHKSGCHRSDTGLSVKCPGFDSGSSVDHFKTYFRFGAREVNCNTTLEEGLYHFTYENNWGRGGPCDNPYSQINTVPDSSYYYDDGTRFEMTYLECPEVETSFSRIVRYSCLGSWHATVGGTAKTFAAIADFRARDRRETFKCLITGKNEWSDDNSTLWAMSRYADCSTLLSSDDGPTRIVLQPVEELLEAEHARITQQLNYEKNATDGDAVDFVVMVTGTEPLTVTWSKDSEPILSSSAYDITYDNGTARLHIAEVFPDDAGFYAVTAKNLWNEDYSMARLEIVDNPDLILRGPKLLEEPVDTTIMPESSAVHLDCSADGRPRPVYSWLKGDGTNMTELQTEYDDRLTVTKGHLTIDYPHVTDVGLYQCRATNEIGTVLSSPAALTMGMLGDFPGVQPAAVKGHGWNGAVIECPPINAKPAVRYAWFKQSPGGPQLFIRSEYRLHTFISNNGKLYFSELRPSDEGLYFCIATLISAGGAGDSAVPSRTSAGISLEVRREVLGEHQPPVIQDDFIRVYPGIPKSGQTIQMECFAYGTVPLEYQWFREGGEIPGTATFSAGNRVMTITNVQIEDSGQYGCRVRSPSLNVTDEKTLSLDVQAEPKFSQPLTDQVVNASSSLSWHCEASAKPAPSYTWYKDGVLLSSSTGVSVTGNTMTIDAVQAQRDNGMYQCAASNPHGLTFSSAQLTVEGGY